MRILILICAFFACGAGWDEFAIDAIDAPQQQQAEYNQQLIDNLQHGRGIAFNDLMNSASIQCRPQAHSLGLYLISIKGRRTFLDCLREARASSLQNRWERVFRRYYGFPNLSAVQIGWLGWVKSGASYQVGGT